MYVSRSIELDYGHTLPNHYSFCNQIHGHRAKVIAVVEGDIVNVGFGDTEGTALGATDGAKVGLALGAKDGGYVELLKQFGVT